MAEQQRPEDVSGQPSAPLSNPMNHPEEQPVGVDGSPKFGRLLIVLMLAVLIIVAITFGSEAYFS